MEIYLAPLEGSTSHIFRQCQLKHFGGVDKYFTPFFTPSEKGVLGAKFLREVKKENNQGQRLVPQILTNNSDGFLTMCKVFKEYGYNEVNLNLGCPSGTVVSKGRGAGFLAKKDELDRFLDDIFKSEYNISIKTRIGLESREEFFELLEIYNKYPLVELIIHPRTRKDMYKGEIDFQMYKYAVENSKNKLCYNGDIFNLKEFEKIKSVFGSDNIMIGRGLVINPKLAKVIRGEKNITREEIKLYYEDVYNGYKEFLSGNVPLMHKMKELFVYMLNMFEDSEKIGKKIKRAKKIEDFNFFVNELFENYEIKNDFDFML